MKPTSYPSEMIGIGGGSAGEWKPRATLEGTDVQGGHVVAHESRILLVTVESKKQLREPIQPGASATLVFTAPIPWAAVSLSVPDELSHRFWIEAMRCARLEFIPTDGVPCSLFSDATCAACRKARVADKLGVSWPIAYPGTPLTVTVQNRSDVPSHFQMTFEALPEAPSYSVF
jgi:hypothetical protein